MSQSKTYNKINARFILLVSIIVSSLFQAVQANDKELNTIMTCLRKMKEREKEKAAKEKFSIRKPTVIVKAMYNGEKIKLGEYIAGFRAFKPIEKIIKDNLGKTPSNAKHISKKELSKALAKEFNFELFKKLGFQVYINRLQIMHTVGEMLNLNAKDLKENKKGLLALESGDTWDYTDPECAITFYLDIKTNRFDKHKKKIKWGLAILFLGGVPIIIYLVVEKKKNKKKTRFKWRGRKGKTPLFKKK